MRPTREYVAFWFCLVLMLAGFLWLAVNAYDTAVAAGG